MDEHIQRLINRHQKDGWIEIDSYKMINNYFQEQYVRSVIPNFDALSKYYFWKGINKITGV